MKLNIYKSVNELLSATVAYFIKIAQQSIAKQGAFTVALSGGNSPKKLFQLLSSNEYKAKVDWSKVIFFFGDERYVPSDDPQSNSLMSQTYLFDPLKITSSQIFKVDTSLSPDEAAEKYNESITAYFKLMPVRFDLILLGLGGNAHTASLFPFTSVLEESSATIKAVFLKEQNSYRITMTAPMINQSKHTLFLVYGKEKAEAVKHVLDDERNVQKYPAQLINPVDGELQWFLDEQAAALLKK